MTTLRSRSVRPRVTLMILVAMGVLFAVVHASLDGVAAFAERRLGAYLWKESDFLRLVSPTYHVGRGRGRLFIYGPSEARESLLPEELAPQLPQFKPYQNAQSWGTLEDALVTFEYIERAYGASAIPDAILLGITPRFIADIQLGPSRLFAGIQKYSPHFTVIEDRYPARLVPKTAAEAIRARVVLLTLQPDRYRRGLFAVANHALSGAVPSLRAHEHELIRAAKYQNGQPHTDAQIDEALARPHWAQVHAWEPDLDRQEHVRKLSLLRGFAARHRIQLFVVNLPEHSRIRRMYRPGRYEAYLDVVRTALGPTPLLDLRSSLADHQFYDESHATWDAAIAMAAQIGGFIRTHETSSLTPRE